MNNQILYAIKSLEKRVVDLYSKLRNVTPGSSAPGLQEVLDEGSTAVLTSDVNISGIDKIIYFGTEYNNDLESIQMSLSGNSHWDIGNRISIYRNDGKASLNFDGEGANFMGTSTNGLNSGRIYLGGGSTSGEGVVLVGNGKSIFLDLNPSNNNYFSLELDAINNLAVFIDNHVIAKGLQYGNDYSANYTDRSLVDKEYVNNRLVVETTSGYTLTNADSGGIVIFKTTDAQTLTIPTGLADGFECTFVTLTGVTLTVVSAGNTLNNTTGSTMAANLSFTLKRMLATNTYITSGNL